MDTGCEKVYALSCQRGVMISCHAW